MKHLPDWVSYLQPAALFRDLLISYFTHFCRRRGLTAMILCLLLSASFPAKAQTPVQWDRTLGGNLWDDLAWLQQTRDGGYIVGGRSSSDISGDKTQASKGGFDYWVVKLDSAGTRQWDKTFGTDSYDGLTVLYQTRDGGYILGGSTDAGINGDKSSPSKGSSDYWILKLDAEGNKIWDKSFGGSGGENLYALQQTADGGYILGGRSYSGISGDKTENAKAGSLDYWVVRLDTAGNKIWDRTIGGNDWDQLDALQQTSDGGYILGGVSLSGISGDKTEASRGDADYWVVKLDAFGNKVWDKTLGGSEGDGHMATAHQILQQTRDGGYVLGGISFSGISGDKTEANRGATDYWVVKLDEAGNKVWDKTIGGSSSDRLDAVRQTLDGGYILGGWSYSGISGDKTAASSVSDYWVVKLDEVGNKVWDKTIGGSGGEGLYALQQTRDGGYILGGDSTSPISGDKTEANKGETDFWIVKLAPAPEPRQVNGFTLINTESEQPIRNLRDGDIIDLADLPTKKLNIRADTNPDSVGSVKFELSGRQTRTYVDNQEPYALFGDIRGDYNKWLPAPGNYTLRATPYANSKAGGEAGIPLTIHFTVKPQQVLGFTLINTESEEAIRTINDGDTIDLADLPTQKLNIRADTKPAAVGSVKFKLRGRQSLTQVDNQEPYALFGDIRGDYEKWYPEPGRYTLRATPYAAADAKGHAGSLLFIHFTVVRTPGAPVAARMVQAPEPAASGRGTGLALYPNPTTDGRLQVQVGREGQGQLSYTLWSAEGRKLAQGSLTPAAKLLEFDFSSQMLVPGLYYLRIEGANLRQVFRIMRR